MAAEIKMTVDDPKRLDPGWPNVVLIVNIPTLRATSSEPATQMAVDVQRMRSGEFAVLRTVVSSDGLVICRFICDASFRRLISETDRAS